MPPYHPHRSRPEPGTPPPARFPFKGHRPKDSSFLLTDTPPSPPLASSDSDTPCSHRAPVISLALFPPLKKTKKHPLPQTTSSKSKSKSRQKTYRRIPLPPPDPHPLPPIPPVPSSLLAHIRAPSPLLVLLQLPVLPAALPFQSGDEALPVLRGGGASFLEEKEGQDDGEDEHDGAEDEDHHGHGAAGGWVGVAAGVGVEGRGVGWWWHVVGGM